MRFASSGFSLVTSHWCAPERRLAGAVDRPARSVARVLTVYDVLSSPCFGRHASSSPSFSRTYAWPTLCRHSVSAHNTQCGGAYSHFSRHRQRVSTRGCRCILPPFCLPHSRQASEPACPVRLRVRVCCHLAITHSTLLLWVPSS